MAGEIYPITVRVAPDNAGTEAAAAGVAKLDAKVVKLGVDANATRAALAGIGTANGSWMRVSNQMDTLDHKIQGWMRSHQAAERTGKDLFAGWKNGANQAAQATDGVTAGLNRMVAAAVLAQGAMVVIGLADSYQQLQNRLGTVTESAGELAFVTEKLFEISNQTRSSVQATTEMYTRMRLATKEMGLTTEQSLQFVKSLNQAVILSGASTHEATAGLIQLSQGLASGTLRGDELRSVLEQLPAVADVIAKQLGVTRGQLRQMGFEGKITADQVVKAFQASKDELDRGFAKTVPTVSQQIVVLKNEAIKLFGEFAQQTKLLELVAALMNKVADAIRDIVKVVSLAVSGIQALNEALGGIPGEALGKIIEYGENAKYIIPGIGQYAAAYDAYNYFTGPDQMMAQTTMEVNEDVGPRQTTSVDYGANGIFLQEKIAREFENQKKMLAKRVKSYRDSTGLSFGESEAEAAAKKAARELEQLRNEYDRFGQSLSSVESATIELSQAEDLLQRAVAAGLTTQEGANEQLKRKRQLLEDQLDPLGKVLKQMEQEVYLLGLDERTRSRNEQALEIYNDLKKQGVQLGEVEIAQLKTALDAQQQAQIQAEKHKKEIDAQREIYDQVWGPLVKYNEGIAAAKALLDANTISLTQYNEQIRRLKAEYQESSKITTPLDELWKKSMPSEESLQAVEKVNQAFLDSFREIGRGLLSLAATARGSFEEFAESAISNIQEVLFQMLLLHAVKSAFGANSDALKFVSNIVGELSGFATGGAFQVPGSGGTDSQLVAFRATPGEHVTIETPQQRRMGDDDRQGGRAGDVIVNNAWDPDLILDVMSSQQGQRVIGNFIASNPTLMRNVRR